MKIFVGSSKEHLYIAEHLASIIEDLDYEHLLWTKLFKPTEITFSKIMDLDKEVDGGIFVLAPDDEIISSKGADFTPRDNVLIEAGILFGKLGMSHVALCRVGNAKIASDLNGITYIPYDPKKELALKKQIAEWLDKLKGTVVNDKFNFDKISLNSILNAFSHVFSTWTHFDHVRIFGFDVLRSASYFKSNTSVTYNNIEILLRKNMKNADMLNKSIDTSIGEWLSMNNIKNVKFVHHDLQTTEGFYIFDDKFLIAGDLHFDLSTNIIEFGNDVITADGKDGAGRKLILNYIEKFNRIKSNYEQ